MIFNYAIIYELLFNRMECYKEITSVLEQLYHQSLLNPYTPSIPLSPGAGIPKEVHQITPAEADIQVSGQIKNSVLLNFSKE